MLTAVSSPQVQVLGLENADLKDRLKLRLEECENLRDDIKSSTEELVSTQHRLREGREVQSAQLSELVPLRHQLKNVERHKELIENHNSVLEHALASKKKEFSDLEKELSDLRFDTDIKLRSTSSELEQREYRDSELNDQISTQNERIDEFLLRIQELEVQSAEKFTKYSAEIDQKDAIITLYKRHHADAQHTVERLERELAAGEEDKEEFYEKLREELQTSLESTNKSTEKLKIDYAEQIRVLEARVLETEQEAARAQSHGRVTPSSESSSNIVPLSLAEGNIESLLAPGELYARYSEGQATIAQERNLRREAELYLNKILRELESKAPVLAKQKNQYSQLVQIHEHLEQRLDSLLKENMMLRSHSQEATHATKAATTDAHSLKQQVKDLGRQLQHVLAKTASQSQQPAAASGSFSTADDVVSNHLVTFDSIQELQTKNEQLLKVVRSLSQEAEEREHSRNGDTSDGDEPSDYFNGSLSDTLSNALLELKKMREERARAEGLVIELVQQRDSYRDQLDALQGALPIGSPGGEAPVLQRSPSGTHAQARKALERARSAVEAEYKDQLNSKEQELSLLSTALATLKAESSESAQMLLKAKVEARNEREKCDRLDHVIRTVKVGLSNAQKAKTDTEKIVTDLRRALSEKESRLRANEEKARALEESCRNYALQAELASAAELSSQQQLSTLKQQHAQEAALAETVQRVEADLSSKREEVKIAVARERDTLTKELGVVRKQLLDLELVHSQKVQTQDQELARLRQHTESRTKEANDARLAAVRLEAAASSAQGRVGLLEKQLASTQTRLSALQEAGPVGLEQALSGELAELEAALSRTLDHVEEKTQHLKDTEAHMEHFRRIGLAAESSLETLRSEHQELQKTHETSLLAEKSLAFKAETGLIKAEEAERDLRKKLDEAAARVDSLENQLDGEQKGHNAALATAQEQIIAAEARAAALSADVRSQEELLSSARSSEEKMRAELQKAQSAQAEATTKTISVRTALALAERSVAELSAGAIQHQLMQQEERRKQELAAEESNERSQLLKRENDLLHAQVQTLSARIGRIEEERASRRPLSNSANTLSNTYVEVPEGGQGQDGEDILAELTDLRRSGGELREVLWTMKREKDMLETRLTASEAEAERRGAGMQTLQKALDEARLAAKREADLHAHGGPTRSETEFDALMTELQNLSSVQDMSARVRADNDALSAENAGLSLELRALKEAASPRERDLSLAESAKASAEAALLQLQEEQESWTERVNRLLDRYKDVDPLAYRQLQEDVSTKDSTLQEREKELSTSILALTEKNKEILAKDTELAAARERIEGMEKSADMLRNKLRSLKTQKEDATKKSADTKAALQTSEAKRLVLEKQIQDVQDEQNETADAVVENTKIDNSAGGDGDVEADVEEEMEAFLAASGEEDEDELKATNTTSTSAALPSASGGPEKRKRPTQETAAAEVITETDKSSNLLVKTEEEKAQEMSRQKAQLIALMKGRGERAGSQGSIGEAPDKGDEQASKRSKPAAVPAAVKTAASSFSKTPALVNPFATSKKSTPLKAETPAFALPSSASVASKSATATIAPGTTAPSFLSNVGNSNMSILNKTPSPFVGGTIVGSSPFAQFGATKKTPALGSAFSGGITNTFSTSASSPNIIATETKEPKEAQKDDKNEMKKIDKKEEQRAKDARKARFAGLQTDKEDDL